MNQRDLSDLLEQQPEDLDEDKVLYALYVRRQIEIGIAAADAGDLIDQDEVEREFAPCPE